MTSETNKTDPMKEIDAMKGVAESLKGLDIDAIERVLNWAAESFGAKIAVRRKTLHTAEDITSTASAEQRANAPKEYSDIATLFADAHPSNGHERALVVAYWLQVIGGTDEFDGQTLNSELTHLGHRLTNVTTTLTQLINQKPAPVIQTKKIGKSNQGRKRYKLTTAGIERVKRMLAEGGNSGTTPSEE